MDGGGGESPLAAVWVLGNLQISLIVPILNPYIGQADGLLSGAL